MAIKTIYHFTALTGGAATALDSVDGNSLLDLDRAFVIVSSIFYVYELDADSGAAESSPNIISPDTNAGTKRWILITSITSGILTVGGGGTGVSTFTDGGLLVGNAANAVQALAAGATTEILVGGGAGVDPVWTTATGTGAPVRATNPTLAGQVVNTTLPAFFAYNSATDTDVTGDGTTFTVIFDTEVFDQGANFDGTSTFTAPVTGKYRLSTAVQLVGMTTTHIYFIIRLVTSNRTYVGANPQFTSVSTVATMPLALNILADMDAGDTATVTVSVPDSTKVVDVQGDLTMQTRFCGELVC